MAENLEGLIIRYLNDRTALDSDIEADLAIHEENLDDDLLHHAELYGKWARLAALAESVKDTLKHEANNVVWNRVLDQVREGLALSGTVATAKYIEGQAYQNAEYGKAAAALINAEYVLATCKAAEKAMWQRKDMLQSYNSRQKTELNGYNNGYEGYRKSKENR